MGTARYGSCDGWRGTGKVWFVSVMQMSGNMIMKTHLLPGLRGQTLDC